MWVEENEKLQQDFTGGYQPTNQSGSAQEEILLPIELKVCICPQRVYVDTSWEDLRHHIHSLRDCDPQQSSRSIRFETLTSP